MAKRTERTQRTAAWNVVVPAAPARCVVDIQELLRVAQPIADQWWDAEMPERIPELLLLCAHKIGMLANWANDINGIDVQRNYCAHSAKQIGAVVVAILDAPHAADNIDDYGKRLAEQARINLAKRGPQNLETLAMVAIEECGELAQAVLRWTKEGIGGFAAVETEAIHLGAVCACRSCGC